MRPEPPPRPDSPRFPPCPPDHRSAETSSRTTTDRTAFRATFPVFAGETPNITVVTDLRSNKVEEIRSNPGGEFAWYFPESREQFRIAGDLTVVSKESAEMQSERSAAWKRMSPAGRAQFAWPTPGFPQLEEGQVRPGTNKQTFDVAEEVTADGSPAHDNFCLVVMDVKEVDHLSLRSNRRYVHVKDEGGEWATTEVNP